MIVVSFLFFMLVHQRAVCNELYPISVVEDIAQNQPEWSTDNDIEPLQGKTYDQMFPTSNLPQNDPTDQEDLKWIKEKIVDYYKFKKDPARDIWTSQPDFKDALGTPDFVSAADRVKTFFDRNNDWEKTKKNPAFRTKDSCTNLLYITAARYLLVTHVLHLKSLEIESGGKRSKLIPCARTVDKKIVIPDTGVCYPAPYGSATCTSDYDVGLVGKDAGYLTEKFNAYFQGVSGFRKPSELVFDTNVYAFTLEFAMPFLFAKLPDNFAKNVSEQTIDFKMQELASAYYKVFKYNEGFFNTMVNEAKKVMTATKSKAQLEVWLNTFNTLRTQVPFRLGGGSLKTLDTFRTAHNNKYQELVKKMSAGNGYKSNFLGDLAKALIYAAEAYHTRGAIRFVVGGTQMKVIDTSPKTPLSTTDLWVSMIENWGESNKEYNHCKNDPLEECFLKMTKYMWRMFSAMRLVRDRIPATERAGLVHFGEKYADPEFAMRMWLDYKKQGKTAIPKQTENVKQFLRQFGCDKAVVSFGTPFSSTCISKMNDKVNAYNVKLAGLLTDEPVKPPWRP